MTYDSTRFNKLNSRNAIKVGYTRMVLPKDRVAMAHHLHTVDKLDNKTTELLPSKVREVAALQVSNKLQAVIAVGPQFLLVYHSHNMRQENPVDDRIAQKYEFSK